MKKYLGTLRYLLDEQINPHYQEVVSVKSWFETENRIVAVIVFDFSKQIRGDKTDG